MHRVSVATPFRLDLTLALLGRFSAQAPDIPRHNDAYVCAVAVESLPSIVAITQPRPDAIEIRIDDAASDIPRTLRAVGRMLGLDAKLGTFERASATLPWLHDLAVRMRGVKPARYPTLWEAGVNAIAFQSVSMLAAAAVVDRFVATFGGQIRAADALATVFPSVDTLASVADAELRAIGLSAAKVRAIRSFGDALRLERWDVALLERLPTAALCARLCEVHGIGPWSAAVIALRGLGRLDVFPLRDSGVVRTVAELCGGDAQGGAAATVAALSALGETRGMLYHLLLLARLDRRGALANPNRREPP